MTRPAGRVCETLSTPDNSTVGSAVSHVAVLTGLSPHELVELGGVTDSTHHQGI